MNLFINLLLFPGLIFSLFMGLIFSGIDRKIVARMQKRRGPKIFQSIYDFRKLWSKEVIIPNYSHKKTFIMAPLLAFSSAGICAGLIPLYSNGDISEVGDILVIIYLLTLSAAALIIGSIASSSPYGFIGASREMVVILSYELPLIIILLAVGKAVGAALTEGVTLSLVDIINYQRINGSLIEKLELIPAILAFLFIIPAKIGSKPFDVAEAETEICEGTLVEYSGRLLALFKGAEAIKMFIMTSLFVTLFLGGIHIGIENIYLELLVNFIVYILISIVLIFFCISLPKALFARTTSDKMFKFFWTFPTILSLISLVLV